MSKEKQIEEMAKLLCGMKNGCDKCMFSKAPCYEYTAAEKSYNAGYRKLPCKIGDRVYCIRKYNGIPAARAGTVKEMYYNTDMSLTITVMGVARGQWGVKIFATREECEQAIKENESRKV